MLSKQSGKNITELNLSNNSMQAKAAVCIGDALIKNPEYPIQQILLRNINIGEDGVHRLMEAANLNKNIRRLHVGILSDLALLKLASKLCSNTGNLLKLEFQEGNYLFIKTLKTRRINGQNFQRMS